MEARRWSFLVPILLFSAASAVVVWMVLYAMGIAFTALHGMFVAWFALVTIGLHMWQERGLSTDPKGFVRRFMAGLMIKMLVSLVLLVLVLLRSPRAEVVVSALVFATLYLAFLAFSTTRLMALSKQAPRN